MAPITLLTLPAELRNEIFELTLTTEHDSTGGATVDLRETSPPRKALSLVCRQAYNETATIYKAAYRKYWTETSFTVDTDKVALTDEGRVAIQSIQAEDIAHITKLHITGACTSRSGYSSNCNVFRVRYGWRYEVQGSSGPRLTVFMAPGRDQVDKVAMYPFAAESDLAEMAKYTGAITVLNWDEIKVFLDAVTQPSS